MAYARVNRLDQTVWESPRARLGIVTTGKAYNDVRQALDDLGIDERHAAEIGVKLFRVAMPWPLEPTGIEAFCRGLEEVVVIEEKRQLVEYQLKEQLYNLPDTERPRIVGKFDSHGEWDLPQSRMLLPTTGELTPAIVARVIAERIGRFHTSDRIKARLAFLEAKEAALAKPVIPIQRIPYFCSGCPHNTSTRVPEGSRALAGIGCHYMAQWMDRSTATFSHMGGEGAAWLGQAPFTDQTHVFAEPRRRHVLPFGLAGDPRGGGVESVDDLQDPVQRRGRDDRRPAPRRPAQRAADQPPDRAPKASDASWW